MPHVLYNDTSVSFSFLERMLYFWRLYFVALKKMPLLLSKPTAQQTTRVYPFQNRKRESHSQFQQRYIRLPRYKLEYQFLHCLSIQITWWVVITHYMQYWCLISKRFLISMWLNPNQISIPMNTFINLFLHK